MKTLFHPMGRFMGGDGRRYDLVMTLAELRRTKAFVVPAKYHAETECPRELLVGAFCTGNCFNDREHMRRADSMIELNEATPAMVFLGEGKFIDEYRAGAKVAAGDDALSRQRPDAAHDSDSEVSHDLGLLRRSG